VFLGHEMKVRSIRGVAEEDSILKFMALCPR